MNHEEAQILTQLAAALGEAVRKLEKFYEKRDAVEFNNAKKAALGFQKQISEVIEK